MLVKIHDSYVHVYKHDYKYKYELMHCMEPDMYYVAINYNMQYVRVLGYNDEEPIYMPQRKIRRELNKLHMNN